MEIFLKYLSPPQRLPWVQCLDFSPLLLHPLRQFYNCPDLKMNLMTVVKIMMMMTFDVGECSEKLEIFNDLFSKKILPQPRGVGGGRN